MSSDDVEQKVIEITANALRLEKGKITPQSRFVDDLGARSLEQVEIMMAFEAAFGCVISDADAAKITTVNQAIEYIRTQLQKQHA